MIDGLNLVTSLLKKQICFKDIELLAVCMRLSYLPREFSYVIRIAAYVPPSTHNEVGCDLLHSIVNRLQTQTLCL